MRPRLSQGLIERATGLVRVDMPVDLSDLAADQGTPPPPTLLAREALG